MVVLMGAEPGKAGDDRAKRHVLHGEGGLCRDVCKALSRRVVSLSVLLVRRRGADEEISVDRRGDEDALAHLRGQHEDRVVHVGSRALVEQVVLALSGSDVDRMGGEHVVEDVSIDACGIYHAL